MVPVSRQPDPALVAFAEEQTGPILRIEFSGWQHAESQVWKLESESGTWFLKSHRQPRKFQQERLAYENWIPLLPDVTAKLIAVRSKPPVALLLTSVPGVVAQAIPLNESQRLQLHRDAGSFLQAMHKLPHVDDDIPVADAFHQRLTTWIARAAGHLPTQDIAWVKRQVEAAIPNLAGMSRVPNHRDFTPRNWMVDSKGQMHVIDFEHSRPDLWFLDIERLWSREWLQHPECAPAFWEGYGRVPSGEEFWLLARCATLSAMSTIVWAREHKDVAFEAQGRTSLDRLRRML